MKNIHIKIATITALAGTLLLACTMPAYSQEAVTGDLSRLEQLQNKNMDYIRQLNRITDDYPLFSYHYEMENGIVKDVTVTGVKNELDTRKIKVVLLNLESNRNKIRNQANRIGVFYAVDQEPEFKGGREALNQMLHENLKYPKDAKNWGTEGTIYVRFVVDADGNIPYATTTTELSGHEQLYARELEGQAVSAVRHTSGQWKPGQINGVNVASYVILPIKFDLQRDPGVPFMIH